jgi:hypothetical protein
MSFEKITGFLDKIYEYISKLDIAYKKTYEKDHNDIFTKDYPYKNFWIDYLKIGRKYFKKSDLFNTKGTIDSEMNSSNKLSEFKILTNEVAIILEDTKFIENCLYLLSSEKLKENKNFIDYALMIKNILATLILSKGGINFFSKNFDLTIILINYLSIATESIVKEPTLKNIVKEENFLTLHETQNMLCRGLLEHPKQSLINKVIINMNTHMDINDDFIIKINFLQIKHLLEILFVVILY